MIHVGHEAARLLLDDAYGGGQFLIAQQAVALAGRLQVVNGIQVDVRTVADERIEIAGHGQIEHQQRSLPPRGVNAAEVLEGHDGLSRAGRADDQVGRGQRTVKFLPRPGLALPRACPLDGPLEAAIDDGDPPGPFVAEITQGFFRHLTRPDDERFLVVEALEDLPGEVGHGHAGNAHATLVDGGFAAYAAGDADGGLKGHVQQRAGGLKLAGRLVGLLDLGQDLRFAEHHAVQTGGHAEQVPHGGFIGVDEQVRHDLAGLDLMKAGQKAADFFQAGDRRRLTGRVDLHAIARGEQHAFHVAERNPPLLQGIFRLLPAEGQAFADGNRSAMMAATHDLDVHESPPVGPGLSGELKIEN